MSDKSRASDRRHHQPQTAGLRRTRQINQALLSAYAACESDAEASAAVAHVLRIRRSRMQPKTR